MLSHFSYVQLFAIWWTIAHHAPVSMGLSRQEYWSGLPCPPPVDIPEVIEHSSLLSPALASRFFTTSATWYKLYETVLFFKKIIYGWVILHCVYVPQLSYPFICWWTSRFLPCPGNGRFMLIHGKTNTIL